MTKAPAFKNGTRALILKIVLAILSPAIIVGILVASFRQFPWAAEAADLASKKQLDTLEAEVVRVSVQQVNAAEERADLKAMLYSVASGIKTMQRIQFDEQLEKKFKAGRITKREKDWFEDQLKFERLTVDSASIILLSK